jgi:hypothetical protein
MRAWCIPEGKIAAFDKRGNRWSSHAPFILLEHRERQRLPFEDHWKIPHPIDRVWDVLATPMKFPEWWQGVYLKATDVESNARRIDVIIGP